MPRMTGGDAIVDSLLRHGIDTIFGLPGVQMYGLFDAFARNANRLRVVNARHEQTTAYMAAEFVARDGIIDERLSGILDLADLGMVIQIRPDKWEVDLFELRQDVMRAFFGSVAFARFLAFHKTPATLLAYRAEGQAPDTERSEYTDD